jgi:hypothetical protein
MAINRNSSNRFVTTQTVSATASSITVANVFGSQSYQIRVTGNTAAHLKIFDITAATTAATTSDAFIPANTVGEYFTVTPGQKCSVIRASTDGLVTATNGSLFISEVSG